MRDRHAASWLIVSAAEPLIGRDSRQYDEESPITPHMTIGGGKFRGMHNDLKATAESVVNNPLARKLMKATALAVLGVLVDEVARPS